MPLRHALNRYRLLWKFIQFSGKAEVLENEWRTIQQESNDYEFENAIYDGKSTEKMIYSRGFVEGIKHCIKRFG